MSGVLGDEEADVEDDDEDVDDDEVSDDLALDGSLHGKDGFEAAGCFPDIKTRDDGFLHKEPRELYALVDVEGGKKATGKARVAAEEQYRNRDVKDANVCDDHDQDPAGF